MKELCSNHLPQCSCVDGTKLRSAAPISQRSPLPGLVAGHTMMAAHPSDGPQALELAAPEGSQVATFEKDQNRPPRATQLQVAQ